MRRAPRVRVCGDRYAGYTVCAPSRTTFFTGRHSGQFSKHGFDGSSLAPGQATTVAEVLRAAGYETAAFGKTAPLVSPVEQGFDYFLGQLDQGVCHNMYVRRAAREREIVRDRGGANPSLRRSFELALPLPRFDDHDDLRQSSASRRTGGRRSRVSRRARARFWPGAPHLSACATHSTNGHTRRHAQNTRIVTRRPPRRATPPATHPPPRPQVPDDARLHGRPGQRQPHGQRAE